MSADDAGRTILDSVGAQLQIDTQESAFGIVEMVDENMSNAARVHTVESGKEIAKYIMITFNGAGPCKPPLVREDRYRALPSAPWRGRGIGHRL